MADSTRAFYCPVHGKVGYAYYEASKSNAHLHEPIFIVKVGTDGKLTPTPRDPATAKIFAIPFWKRRLLRDLETAEEFDCPARDGDVPCDEECELR